MTKASDNIFPKLIGAEGAAPGTPAAATAILYVKADGLWYSKDDAGVETLVSGGAAGMTNPMTTQGDIISGGASGAPGRLAIGTAGQVLTVNAGGTAPEWAAGGGGGGSALPLDSQASAASYGSGDDFSGTTLDGGWSSLDATPLTTVDASIDGYLVLGNSAAVGNGTLRGIDRAFSPAGDFMIWMRLDNIRVPGDFVGAAVFAGATDPSNAASAKRIDAVVYDSSGSWRCQVNKWSSGTGTNVFDADIGATPLWLDQTSSGRVFPMWVALRRVGTALSMGVSQDGIEFSWHTTTTTIDFTVATFGISLMQQGSSLDRCVFIDYIATSG